MFHSIGLPTLPARTESLTMDRQELLGLLLKAAASSRGIVVSTNDPDALRQKLYPLRKEDPSFEKLTFIIHPKNPTRELIIGVKKNGDT